MTKKTSLAFGVALVSLAAAAQATTAEITSVKANKTEDGGYQVVVSGTNLTKPKTIRVTSNKMFILEFDANLGIDRGRVNVGTNGIDYVQYGWFQNRPPKVRVALKLDNSIEPVVTSGEGTYTIKIGGKAVPVKPIVKNDTEPVKPKGDGIPELPVSGDFVPFSSTPKSTATDKIVANQVVAGAQLVSLDFVGTDVIQILKALSLQSSVNIIASPEVSPADKPTKLTVALNRVSLDDALSFVTAMSGLRYARVGDTYIVTPASTFQQSMRQVMERSGSQYETRVVNLISGEAEKIKEATLKALPQDGRSGFYEVIVPGKNDIPGLATPPVVAQEGQTPAPNGSTPQPSGRVYYLMVVGDTMRLDDIETYIRDLDFKVAKSTSFSRSDDLQTIVVPVQSGETGRIKQMIDRLVAEHPRGAEFSVTESILEGTTKGEAQTMALLMFGPKDELNRLESWAKALDRDICSIMGRPYEADNAGLEKMWDVVELNFVEPSMVELDLKTRFKGLQVSLMPDAVTPGLRGTTSSNEQNTGATGAGTGQGTGAAADGGSEQQSESTSEQRTITGREPMKIVLRGTRAQIVEARQYIEMIDVAPKQIALELRVMDLTKEEALRIGIDWSALTGGRILNYRLNQGLGDTSATPGTISKNTAENGSTNDNLDFLATLDKLNNGRNLLARPNALVTDGRETNLFVGDTVRYIKTIQSTQNGTTVETDEVNVGVTFNVRARIGGDGTISLDLLQNFSILTGFTPVPGGGNLPQTSDRRSNMFVNMKSGETLAIGGLILEQDRKSVSGIPILKDLPIIGYLFSRTDNSRQRTEIVFFLTAVTVDENTRGTAASPATGEQRVPDPMGDYFKGKEKKNSIDSKTTDAKSGDAKTGN